MPAATTTLKLTTSPALNDEASVITTTTIPCQPSTMQPLEWRHLPSSSSDNNNNNNNNTNRSLIVAVWPTDTFYQGLQTISPSPRPLPNSNSQITTPLIHVPHCYLSVTSYTPLNSHTPGLVERVGLPRSLVQGFLSSIRLPSAGNIVGLDNVTYQGGMTAVPHADDQDDWVFSRCLLADFTGFSEEASVMLSRQGRLCCWISVVLDGSSGVWDLGFVVHRVGVCEGRGSKMGGGCLRGVC